MYYLNAQCLAEHEHKGAVHLQFVDYGKGRVGHLSILLWLYVFENTLLHWRNQPPMPIQSSVLTNNYDNKLSSGRILCVENKIYYNFNV